MTPTKPKILSVFSTAVLCLLMLLQVACTDNSVSTQIDISGTPHINGVRYVSPDSSRNISEIGPGAVVALMGKNMDATTQVYFNGIEASFNPVMVTDSTLIVTVPSDLPFGSLDPNSEVMNTIRVANDNGESVLDFKVVPPTPQISSISNEFARDGRQLTITGQYLYLIESITFPGGAEATDFQATNDGTSLTVTVPSGSGTDGYITITTPGGTSAQQPSAQFRATSNVFYNFDDKNGFTPWGPEPVVTDSYAPIPALSGSYLHWHEESIPVGTWWVQNLATPSDGAQLAWPDEISGSESLSNLVLEFELYVAKGINSGRIQFQLAGKDHYWTPWLEGDTRSTFTTDGWTTIRIPLSEYTDTGLSTYADIKGKALNLFYTNGTGVTVPLVDFGWDNFRVVRTGS